MVTERKTNLQPEVLERFISMYKDPNITMAEMERIFKRRPGTLYRWGFELGLKRPKNSEKPTLPLEQVHQYCLNVSMHLPPVMDAQGEVVSTAGHDYEEHKGGLDLVLFLSDLHAGRYTVSYNAAVFARRMEALAARVLAKAVQLSSIAPIRRLNIFSLGDLVSGERVGHQITLEELEHAVLTQVYSIAIPRLTQFTYQMANHFKQVDIHAVPGNHGVIVRPAISAANWDTVVNYGWEAKCSMMGNVRFEVEAINWYKYATIRHMDWLLTHGDAVRGGQPYSALAAKLTKWETAMPEHFDAVACGHFHHFNKIQKAWMNGTLVTDDDWSREVVGRDSECMQLLLAQSDKGIEYVMPIMLDDIVDEEEDIRL